MRAFLLLAAMLAVGGPLEASSEASSPRFMDRLMSTDGCGRFAGLINATDNATETFQSSLAHGGLVVFCPDDKAVAAFEPKFYGFCADQLLVLLYHGVAPASLGDRRPTTKALTVPTLATDDTDSANGVYYLNISYRGDAMELSSYAGVDARVTRKVTDEEAPLVVYLIDAVLLPREPILCDDSSTGEGWPWFLEFIVFVLIFLGAVVVFAVLLLICDSV